MFSCLLVTESSTIFPHALSNSLKIEIIRLIKPYISTSKPMTCLYMLRLFLSAQQLKKKPRSYLHKPLNSVSISPSQGLWPPGFSSFSHTSLISMASLSLVDRHCPRISQLKKRVIVGPYSISQLTDYLSTPVVCFLRVLYDAVSIASTCISFESNIGAYCLVDLFSELHVFWPFFNISFARYFHSTKPLGLGVSPTSTPSYLLPLCLSFRGLHQLLYFLN